LRADRLAVTRLVTQSSHSEVPDQLGLCGRVGPGTVRVGIVELLCADLQRSLVVHRAVVGIVIGDVVTELLHITVIDRRSTGHVASLLIRVAHQAVSRTKIVDIALTSAGSADHG